MISQVCHLHTNAQRVCTVELIKELYSLKHDWIFPKKSKLDIIQLCITILRKNNYLKIEMQFLWMIMK